MHDRIDGQSGDQIYQLNIMPLLHKRKGQSRPRDDAYYRPGGAESPATLGVGCLVFGLSLLLC